MLSVSCYCVGDVWCVVLVSTMAATAHSSVDSVVCIDCSATVVWRDSHANVDGLHEHVAAVAVHFVCIEEHELE